MKAKLFHAISKIRYLALLMLLTISVGSVLAADEVTIASWGKVSISANTAVKASGGDVNNKNVAQFTSTKAMTTAGTNCYYASSAGGAVITFSSLTLSGYSDITMTFYTRASQQGNMKIEYTTNGTTWTTLDDPGPSITKSEAQKTSSKIPNTAIGIKLTHSAGTGSLYFGTIVIKGTATASDKPTITVNPTSIAFGTKNIDEAPFTETFVVKGSNLTAPISLSGLSGVFSLSPSSVSVADAQSASGKTITVTYNPTSVGTTNQTITLSSTGADNKTVSVSGTSQRRYGVHYSVGGEEVTSLKELVISGGKVSALPTADDVTSCDVTNYPHFVGWSKTNFGSQKTEPTTLVTGSETITSETTYYAVFAKGTAGSSTTATYTFEANATTPWSNSFTTLTNSQGVDNSKAGSITGSGQVTYGNKVAVTSFSFCIKRTTTNSNGTVYVEKSTNNSTWTQCTSYGISDFGNGSYTTKTYDGDAFDGNEYYVRVRYSSTGGAQRYIDNVSITYGSAPSYTEWITSCCTPLGQINGSLSLTHVKALLMHR